MDTWSLQKYCLPYSAAGTLAGHEGGCEEAVCVLDYWEKRQISPPLRGTELCSGVGTSDTPKQGRERKCLSQDLVGSVVEELGFCLWDRAKL